MKIAYFGFDLFYDCIEQIQNCGNEILKIFTCKVDGNFETNNKIYNFAYKNKIEITDKKVTKDDIEQLIKKGCDLIFSAGYYYKIPVNDDIEGINIHPAILPIGRGPWPQPVTILKGLHNTGVTLHRLSEDFDCGDILHIRKFVVDMHENLETINQKYLECARQVTYDFFSSPEYFFTNALPQGQGEYWHEPGVEDMTFSVCDNYDRVDLVTRAFYGYCCYCKLKNKTLKIVKAKCFKQKPFGKDICDLIEINGGWVAILKYA